VQNLRVKDLTEGITITSKYEERKGESYETEWTINPLLLEGSGYFDCQGLRGSRCKPWRTRQGPWSESPRTSKER